jgi:protein O-GlcNAc transferase
MSDIELYKADYLFRTGSTEKAKTIYKEILEKNPKCGEAHYGLAEIYIISEDSQRAWQHLFQAYLNGNDPEKYAKAFFNYSIEIEQIKEAIICIEENVTNNEIEILLCLSDLYFRNAQIDKAYTIVLKLLKIDPLNIKILLKLADIEAMKKQYQNALQHTIQAREIAPFDSNVHYKVSIAFQDLYLNLYSIEESLRALFLKPSSLALKCRILLNTEENSLDNLCLILHMYSNEKSSEAYRFIGEHNNFYSHYKEENFCVKQRLYGEFVTKVLEDRYPDLQYVPPLKTHSERLRIGFISESFHEHSVYYTHGKYLSLLDKSKFEIFFFNFGVKEDSIPKDILDACDHYCHYLGGTFLLKNAVKKIRSWKLDRLIFPDIGMSALSILLASFRYAEKQYTTTGHPITSGMESIDYFISSELMEPPDAESQYSETLIRLNNLASCYPEPFADMIPAVDSPLPAIQDGKTRYINLQSLFKLIPEYDFIYPQIALQNPNSVFYFIKLPIDDERLKLFEERLERAFSDVNLDFKDYCIILPRMNKASFYRCLKEVDIVLDSPGWSGFNTSMQACFCDLPIVTLEGKSMRANHTTAILKLLKLEELIAKSSEEYIKIAISLSKDPSYPEKIRYNKHRLYNDVEVIRSLELLLLAPPPIIKKEIKALPALQEAFFVSDTHLEEGSTLEKKGEYKKAMMAYQRAFCLNPHSKRASFKALLTLPKSYSSEKEMLHMQWRFTYNVPLWIGSSPIITSEDAREIIKCFEDWDPSSLKKLNKGFEHEFSILANLLSEAHKRLEQGS